MIIDCIYYSMKRTAITIPFSDDADGGIEMGKNMEETGGPALAEQGENPNKDLIPNPSGTVF